MSRDPLLVTPNFAQAYGYAGANPIAFQHPIGLDRCGWKDPLECGRKLGSSTVSSAADAISQAKDLIVELVTGVVTDPLVQLSLAQFAATTAAVLACPAAFASGGIAAPACAAAVALVGYTTWAKQGVIANRYKSGAYNEAEFICRLLATAPVPYPNVFGGVTMPLCPALGKGQDLLRSIVNEY